MLGCATGLALCVFIGLVQPPEGITEIGFGIQQEGEPFRARAGIFGIDARFFLSALQEFRWQRLDSEDERAWILDGARNWQCCKDFLATIEAAQAEHRPRCDSWPSA